ncbi:MICOS complex subunit Mic60-like isoform X2 [Physella acuta]|uniref:MICOS complex subunit Mic60-like isoform X2 n=1 Tax=Physella acuta TaxID=109671 RepID=UPI0027DB3F60|nr:MICOS complex subunit Mic60-like isoform X2 [Physella acuta]
MWRSQTSKQTKLLVRTAKRQLTSESTPPPKPLTAPPVQSQLPKKSGGFRLFKFFGFGLPAAATSLLGYAWYDPNFRKQLEANVPYAKEVLESVLPESKVAVHPDRVQDLHPVHIVEKPSILNVQESMTQPVSNQTDQYFSYIPPSRGKDKEIFTDEDGKNMKNETAVNDKDDSRVDRVDTVNLREEFEEKKLAEEMLTNKNSPLQNLTEPSSVQNQSYQILELQRDDLLRENFSEASDVKTALMKETSQTEEVPLKKEEKKIDPRVIDAQLKKREDDAKADNAALEVAIHKLLTNSERFTEEAIQAQKELASSIRNHTKLLKQAMDDTSDILQKDAQWEAVAIAYKEREHAFQRANELSIESKKSLERLKDVITEGKVNQVTKQNPAIFPASKRVNDLLKDMTAANSKVREAEAESNVMQKYKELVDKGRKQFQKEIESILPDAKISSGKKLSEDELNALIAHAHRRIEQLQKQIAEQLAMERQRLSAALEAQRLEDLKITDATVAEERMRLQQEFDFEKQKLEMEFYLKLEAEVRKQLARQAAAHSDHLRDVLSVQQRQLNVEFDRELNAKLLEEREKFQSEVAGWISRLKGIEAAVDARAASEKLARSAQDLWLACISLKSAIQFGEAESETQSIPLRNRIEAILNSGNKHPFVETVANTVAPTVLDRGVSTEDQLRNRFFRVSQICRRLGLINEPNTSLYKYFISYLHSLVVFDRMVPMSEYDEIDLNSLDNFALIAYAQHWMERGNLEIALRFMMQLTGESRRAASDWINEAKLLLETKQSAYALTAYASASGLANTF